MTYEPSESGRYKVELARVFERRQFLYKPGHSIIVSQAVLDEMIEAEAVANVVAAD